MPLNPAESLDSGSSDGVVEEIITTLSRIPLALRDRPQFELHLRAADVKGSGSCRIGATRADFSSVSGSESSCHSEGQSPHSRKPFAPDGPRDAQCSTYLGRTPLARSQKEQSDAVSDATAALVNLM